MGRKQLIALVGLGAVAENQRSPQSDPQRCWCPLVGLQRPIVERNARNYAGDGFGIFPLCAKDLVCEMPAMEKAPFLSSTS